MIRRLLRLFRSRPAVDPREVDSAAGLKTPRPLARKLLAVAIASATVR